MNVKGLTGIAGIIAFESVIVVLSDMVQKQEIKQQVKKELSQQQANKEESH